MGQKFLIDTNVIIDYTSSLLPDKASNFVEQVFNTAFNISVITKIETLGYNETPAKMQLLEKFLATATIYPLDDAIIQKTIELIRFKKIKLGDAIITATAVVHGFDLISRNTKDFANVAGLGVIDPYML